MAENRWLDPRCSLLDIPSNIDGNFIELGDGRLMSMVGNRQAFGTPIEGISVSDDDGKTWSTPRPVHEGAASGPPACGVLIRTREGVCIAVYASSLHRFFAASWQLEHTNLIVVSGLSGKTPQPPRDQRPW